MVPVIGLKDVDRGGSLVERAFEAAGWRTRVIAEVVQDSEDGFANCWFRLYVARLGDPETYLRYPR